MDIARAAVPKPLMRTSSLWSLLPDLGSRQESRPEKSNCSGKIRCSWFVITDEFYSWTHGLCDSEEKCWMAEHLGAQYWGFPFIGIGNYKYPLACL